jgi:hypothetical protein
MKWFEVIKAPENDRILRRVVSQKLIDVSEVRTASIIRAIINEKQLSKYKSIIIQPITQYACKQQLGISSTECVFK